MVGVIQSLQRSTLFPFPAGGLSRSNITFVEYRKKRALADEELARSEALADRGSRIGYEIQWTVDKPVGAERERVIGVGVKIPLPVRKKGEGRILENTQGRIALIQRVMRAIEDKSVAFVGAV